MPQHRGGNRGPVGGRSRLPCGRARTSLARNAVRQCALCSGRSRTPPIEAEADGAFCFAAVEVVDEERLDFLGRENSPDRLCRVQQSIVRLCVSASRELRLAHAGAILRSACSRYGANRMMMRPGTGFFAPAGLQVHRFRREFNAEVADSPDGRCGFSGSAKCERHLPAPGRRHRFDQEIVIARTAPW